MLKRSTEYLHQCKEFSCVELIKEIRSNTSGIFCKYVRDYHTRCSSGLKTLGTPVAEEWPAVAFPEPHGNHRRRHSQGGTGPTEPAPGTARRTAPDAFPCCFLVRWERRASTAFHAGKRRWKEHLLRAGCWRHRGTPEAKGHRHSVHTSWNIS